MVAPLSWSEFEAVSHSVDSAFGGASKRGVCERRGVGGCELKEATALYLEEVDSLIRAEIASRVDGVFQ